MEKQQPDIADWRLFVKQWRIGVVVTLLSIGAACAVLSQLTTYYKAHVQLLLPLKLVEEPDDRKSSSPQQADIFVVKSFTDLVTDDGIARKVIRDLKLAQDPEFQPTPNWFSDTLAKVSQFLTNRETGVPLFVNRPAMLTPDRRPTLALTHF